MAADSQYVIDIASQMSGGEHTIAQLDQLTAQLMGSGKGAEHFQAAIVEVSNALDAAKIASASANDALFEGQAHYATLERAALQAAKAAEKAALKNDGVVPFELAARVAETSSAVEGYTDMLRVLEKDAAAATAGEDALAKSLTNVRKLSAHVDKSLANQQQNLSKLRGSLNALPGPAGKLGASLLAPVDGFTKLSGSMGAAKAVALVAVVGIVAVTAAVAALGVALAASAVALAAWAVKLADGARSAELAREALEAMHPEFGAARSEIAALQNDTGLTEASLNGLTKSLIGAKVSAADMPAALRAAALAEAALGQGGAADFVSQLKDGKLSVEKFAATAQTKFGGVVAKQMRGLDAQGARLKKNIAGLFSGLNIEPVLDGMSTLVGMFDATSVAGQTIKFLFEEIFQPLINQAQKAAYVVEAFYLGFLIGAVKLFIALKPAIKAVQEFFGFEDTALADTLLAAKNIGTIVAYVFAGVIAAVGVGLAAAFVVAAAGIAAIFGPIALLIAAFGALIVGVKAAWDFLSGLNFGDIGRAIVDGLVNGITAGAGAIFNAITGAVKGAIDGAKKLLGIASPSKVFAEIGVNTGEGFVEGVDDTAPDAHSAMADMADPKSALANVSSPADSALAASAEPAGASANLAGATFNFYGVEGAEDAEARFGELITRILEGDALQSGAPV